MIGIGAATARLVALLTAGTSGGVAVAQRGYRTTQQYWQEPRGAMLLGSRQRVRDGRTTRFAREQVGDRRIERPT